MVSNEAIKFVVNDGPYVISSAPSTTSVNVLNTFNKKGGLQQISIGPSECGNERDGRASDVNSVWKSLDISKFIPGQFRSVLDLFREALSCYQNGAYMASCIMCRTATESLLFIAINSEYDHDKREIKFMRPQNKEKGGQKGYMKYDEILREANKYLNDNEKKWLEPKLDSNGKETGLIRHSGDIVAHYSEKISEEISSLSASQLIEFWKDKDSTLEILKKTALVIKMVNDRYKSVNMIH
ncbi:MAG: hypothetical protein RE469_04295 [Cuniculiplasma divulgatum]|nr:MAG: hypothetical protein RE469_04295 [Cuniculiplasma divulgatum]